MNWDAVGAIGEVAGAFAVVITLVYLAIQVRHARSDLKQSFRIANETAEREVMFEQIRNPLLMTAQSKIKSPNAELGTLAALQEMGDLSDGEAQALNAFISLRFRLYSDQIRNIELLGREEIDVLNGRIKFVFSRGAGKIWFQTYESHNLENRMVILFREILDQDVGA